MARDNVSYSDPCQNGKGNTKSHLEEGQRLCPLCQAEVRLFFINFNDKVLMCENVECEYPFGYEDLTFAKDDIEINPDEEVLSIRSRLSESPSGSITSTAAWSEIDKLNRIYDLEDDSRSVDGHDSKNKDRLKEIEQKNEEIMKHIEDIKVLNMELMIHMDTDNEDEVNLQNEKWIKKLQHFQMSGLQLLKAEEVGLLKKEEPVLGLGELKIDIDPGNDDKISSIKIEIHNRNDAGGKDKED